MNPSIVVVGSTNTDMVIKTDRLPAPGETVLGGTFFMNPGGKGANQAVAAARLGGCVTFVAKIGSDIFGEQAVQLFKNEGIVTDYIVTDAVHPSGVALITVDKNAENCIVVASGANATLHQDDVQKAADVITKAAIVLMQLETPMDTISFVAKLASSNGVKVILNPAPAFPLPENIYQHLSIITPNKKEAEMLTGMAIVDDRSAIEAAKRIQSKGVATVIITLGSRGALVVEGDSIKWIPAPVVTAVDTTAAGDVFNGALAVALSEHQDIEQAVTFACKAAALSVTRLGAQASAPYKEEVDAYGEIVL